MTHEREKATNYIGLSRYVAGTGAAIWAVDRRRREPTKGCAVVGFVFKIRIKRKKK